DANKMWIVPSEFSKALEGLSRLGGAEEGKSWLDVGASPNGGTTTATAEIDTSDWFESQLPPAAEQREAKIELSSIADTPMPAGPSLAQAKEEVQEIGSAELP
ncbi:MAG: SPFH domain-containing protein, partial [Blastococcus sp.]